MIHHPARRSTDYPHKKRAAESPLRTFPFSCPSSLFESDWLASAAILAVATLPAPSQNGGCLMRRNKFDLATGQPPHFPVCGFYVKDLCGLVEPCEFTYFSRGFYSQMRFVGSSLICSFFHRFLSLAALVPEFDTSKIMWFHRDNLRDQLRQIRHLILQTVRVLLDQQLK